MEPPQAPGARLVPAAFRLVLLRHHRRVRRRAHHQLRWRDVWAALPFTLPQFVVGLMLGHVRVRYGLWASVLLHAAHNSLFVLLLLAGTG